MEKFLKFTFLFLTIVLAIVSCKKDNTDTINPYDEQGLVLINANINELINNIRM